MPYAEERKEAVLSELMPPHNRTAADVAREEGIFSATPYNWRKEARERVRLLPAHSSGPEGWSARDSSTRRSRPPRSASRSWGSTAGNAVCIRSRSGAGAAPVRAPMTRPMQPNASGARRSRPRRRARASSSVSSSARMRRWLRRRRY